MREFNEIQDRALFLTDKNFATVIMAGGGASAVEQLMAAQMVQAAKVVEERLDEEMDRLENLNDEELDKVRCNNIIHNIQSALLRK